MAYRFPKKVIVIENATGIVIDHHDFFGSGAVGRTHLNRKMYEYCDKYGVEINNRNKVSYIKSNEKYTVKVVDL